MSDRDPRRRVYCGRYLAFAVPQNGPPPRASPLMRMAASWSWVVLDMDSSESPTYGEQEGSAYNGISAAPATTRVFNQLGDVERCALRPVNVHSADRWRVVLEPVVARYRDAVKRLYLRLSPTPRSTSSSKPSAWVMRSGCGPIAFCRARSDTCSSARLGDRRTRCAASTPVSAIGRRVGKSRAASWPRSSGIRELSPACGLYRHQPGATNQACRLLQPARHSGAMDQGGHRRD